MSEEIVQLEMKVGACSVKVNVPVPAEPVPAEAMFPFFQGLTHAVIDSSVAEAEKHGRTVSCAKGCSACCRHLVPISEPEARHLLGVLAAMEPERRRRIEQRFEAIMQRADEKGLTAALLNPQEGLRRTAYEYFQLDLFCPFLEDDACGIHPDRPLTCREHLVTSPPVHCADPTQRQVDVVQLPVVPSNAMNQLETGEYQFVVLPALLRWASTRPADYSWPEKTGPEWMTRFMGALLPPPAPPAAKPEPS